MSRTSLFALCCLLSVGCQECLSQAPDTLWTRWYGGGYYDDCYAMISSIDGGYILGGSTNSFGVGTGSLIVKTNAVGDTEWTRVWSNEFAGRIQALYQTEDGGYVAADEDFRILRLSASGSIVWRRDYYNIYARAWAIQQTTDGGFVAAGSHYGLMRMNADGDTLWTRLRSESVRYARQTMDSGFIVVGDITSGIVLVKTNELGETTWRRTYNVDGNIRPNIVKQTREGGYIVGGMAEFYGSYSRNFLWKFNAAGDTVWTNSYYSSWWGSQGCMDVLEMDDGGYVVILERNGVVRTDSQGDTLWTRNFWEFGVSEQLRAAAHGGNGTIAVAGDAWHDQSFTDFFLGMLDSETGGISEPRLRRPVKMFVESAFPNPSNSTITLIFSVRDNGPLTLALYDVLGRKAVNLSYPWLAAGRHFLSLDLSSFPSGQYFLAFRVNNEVVHSQKLLLLK